MSSISGPGQKLPRASIVRVIGGRGEGVGHGWDVLRLDEQRGGALGHQLDDGGGADGLAHALDQVLAA